MAFCCCDASCEGWAHMEAARNLEGRKQGDPTEIQRSGAHAERERWVWWEGAGGGQVAALHLAIPDEDLKARVEEQRHRCVRAQ